MKNLFDIQGRYALVTGASSGIGRQFAKALAGQGVNVAVAAWRVERLEALKTEIEALGVKCLPCAATCPTSRASSIAWRP